MKANIFKKYIYAKQNLNPHLKTAGHHQEEPFLYLLSLKMPISNIFKGMKQKLYSLFKVMGRLIWMPEIQKMKNKQTHAYFFEPRNSAILQWHAHIVKRTRRSAYIQSAESSISKIAFPSSLFMPDWQMTHLTYPQV